MRVPTRGRQFIAAVLAFGAATALAGCSASTSAQASGRSAPSATPRTATSSAPASSAPATSTSAPPADRNVHPNELGVVPVLMYHQVVRRPKGIYDITPRAFRSELERLARNGFVPVTATDYATGHIDIPAGTHPVVLTFDDSTRSQLTLDDRDDAVPGTAVAILLDVAARHPDFTPTATFFVNRDPFADPGGARYLGWLRDHGFEVGNHTLDHVSLASLSPRQVKAQLAGDSRLIQRATGGAPVTALALPFGIRPHNRRLMMAGAWKRDRYAFDAAFLVGAGPAPSPYSRSFQPSGVPRIRSQGRHGAQAWYGSSAWLDRLAKHPGGLYTSDGDPATVSFPARLGGQLRAHLPAGAAARRY